MKRFKYLALAALVAFAACDEGDDPVVDTPTGTISGVVTIEGVGKSGITVTLSSGATATTDGSGAYSFSNVAAGAYTVTISGFAADVTFSASTKAATITTDGQTSTVNFDGAYVRTSSIVGSVAAGGSGLSGVSVALSGAGTGSATTDANGQYGFTGLRAGSYTVTISGYDASTYSFASNSKSVTLTAGQSQFANFEGQLVTTAKISGVLFLDENAPNGTFDSTEDALKVANVTIQLEGGAVNNTLTVETDANGAYSFDNLAAGTYRLTILNATGATIDADLPGNVAFRTGAATNQLVQVTTGTTGTANWPFNITQQAISNYVYLAPSLAAAGVAPVKGTGLRLYNTYANAVANAGTAAGGMIGSGTTDASGLVTFRFARSADTGPAGGATDNVVFARVQTIPALHALVDAAAQTVMEIKYSPKDSLAAAPDTFAMVHNQVVLGFAADEIDGDPASGWNVALKSNKDSTSAATAHGITDAKGMAYYTLTPAASITAGGDGVFPDTLWVRLSTGQTANNAHVFSTTIAGDEGTKTGRYVRFIWNGTVAASDTVVMGTETIKYLDADIMYRAHHEADDSTGVTATYTTGDDFTEVGNVTVKILNADGTVARPAAALTAVGAPASLGAGSDRKYNLATGKTFTAVAQSTWGKLSVLTDTVVTFTLDGGNQVDTLDVLKGGAGASTFAYKLDNGTVNGLVVARDGTAASGLKVHVKAGPGNIQGTQDTTVVTGVGGAFTTNANLREGPYTVTIADSTTANGTVWGFSVKLTTATVPVSGSVNNTDAYTGLRDLQGNADIEATNFLPDRMDTKVQGLIANDRDMDENTIDPNEALAGAEVKLYKDNSGTPTVSADSLVATATTDATGAFVFPQLREGTYIVKPTAGTPAGQSVVILRGLTNGDTAIVHTAAAAAVAGTGNPDGNRTVGITSGFTTTATTGIILPRWDYSNSTYNLKSALAAHSQPHFSFLYGNGQATGTVTKTAVAVSGMTISAVKCATAAGYTTPPTVPIGAGTCAPTGSAVNVTTDSTGKFLFTGLQEGVWMVTANPATAGLADPVTSALFVILGNADVETGNFAF